MLEVFLFSTAFYFLFSPRSFFACSKIQSLSSSATPEKFIGFSPPSVMQLSFHHPLCVEPLDECIRCPLVWAPNRRPGSAEQKLEATILSVTSACLQVSLVLSSLSLK
uniref:Uncharacterized protein n=1 Tax=Arundo donax TaxID=35708 RepID=A0A0A9DQ30_ARUDO